MSQGPKAGGQPGNQNARRHGLFSRLNPPDPDELRQHTKDAIRWRDVTELRLLARAWSFHGDAHTAHHLRALATRLERGELHQPQPKGDAMPDE